MHLVIFGTDGVIVGIDQVLKSFHSFGHTPLIGIDQLGYVLKNYCQSLALGISVFPIVIDLESCLKEPKHGQRRMNKVSHKWKISKVLNHLNEVNILQKNCRTQFLNVFIVRHQLTYDNQIICKKLWKAVNERLAFLVILGEIALRIFVTILILIQAVNIKVRVWKLHELPLDENQQWKNLLDG